MNSPAGRSSKNVLYGCSSSPGASSAPFTGPALLGSFTRPLAGPIAGFGIIRAFTWRIIRFGVIGLISRRRITRFRVVRFISRRRIAGLGIIRTLTGRRITGWITGWITGPLMTWIALATTCALPGIWLVTGPVPGLSVGQPVIAPH